MHPPSFLHLHSDEDLHKFSVVILVQSIEASFVPVIIAFSRVSIFSNSIISWLCDEVIFLILQEDPSYNLSPSASSSEIIILLTKICSFTLSLLAPI